jgi:hypothetical protein
MGEVAPRKDSEDEAPTSSRDGDENTYWSPVITSQVPPATCSTVCAQEDPSASSREWCHSLGNPFVTATHSPSSCRTSNPVSRSASSRELGGRDPADIQYERVPPAVLLARRRRFHIAFCSVGSLPHRRRKYSAIGRAAPRKSAAFCVPVRGACSAPRECHLIARSLRVWRAGSDSTGLRYGTLISDLGELRRQWDPIAKSTPKAR